MKSYEIAHQGSRYVVKTPNGSGGFHVSAPFKTHAAAQGYIDQQRAAAGDLSHDGQDQSEKVIADTNGYEAAGSKYGFTVYEGKQFAMTGTPSFAGVFGLGISADNYSVACIDEDGKKYTAYFEILEKDADNVVLADWDNASLVQRV